MEILKTTEDVRSALSGAKAAGKRIGFVPTMGALHEGHLKLVDACKEKCDIVVVSIFVNPTQFGPNEDFEKYPRNYESDAKLLEERGANFVFLPTPETIYPNGHSTWVVEEKLSTGMCGISRPGHFRGVTTVVNILFNIVQPDVALFGEKDAQQLAILQKMVKDLHMPIEILSVPTLRESDGLAMSSRNNYLSPKQREEALRVPEALQAAQKLIANGFTNSARILAEVRHILTQTRRIRVIYVEVVNRETLEPIEIIEPGNSLIAVAVWVDDIRLIDNIRV